MSILELHRTEVDGVPAFWIDAHRPTLTASLVFRVGLVDQPATRSGFLHLLEHVVLQGSEQHGLEVNGSVDPTFTSFDVEGGPEDVVAHLAEVTARMQRLFEAKLDHERAVLAAEDHETGTSPLDLGLLWRFGAHGLGAVGLGNFALHAATPGDLQALADQWLTRGNAALVLSGPPPADLTLRLHEGSPRPLPSLPPMLSPRGCYLHGMDGVFMHGVVTRCAATNAAHRLLDHRLLDTLRHREGLVYSVQSDYDVVAADRVLLWAGAETKDASHATATSLSTIEDLASTGPTSNELADLKVQLLRDASDPFNAYSWARVAATAHLDRGVDRSPAAIVEGFDQVTPEAVAGVFGEFIDTTILGVPDEDHRRLVPLPALDEPNDPAPYDVRATYRAIVPLPGSPVVRTYDEGVHVTVRHQASLFSFNSIAACRETPGGVRALLRTDGSLIELHTHVMHHGDELRSFIDEGIPPELRVRVPDDEDFEAVTTTRGELGRDILGVLGWLVLAVTCFGGVWLYRTRPDIISLPTLAGITVVGAGAFLLSWLWPKWRRRLRGEDREDATS